MFYKLHYSITRRCVFVRFPSGSIFITLNLRYIIYYKVIQLLRIIFTTLHQQFDYIQIQPSSCIDMLVFCFVFFFLILKKLLLLIKYVYNIYYIYFNRY